MKTTTMQFCCAAVLLLSLLSAVQGSAQITPSGDSYTNKSLPTTNFGSNPLLDVNGATQTTYIQLT